MNPKTISSATEILVVNWADQKLMEIHINKKTLRNRVGAFTAFNFLKSFNQSVLFPFLKPLKEEQHIKFSKMLLTGEEKQTIEHGGMLLGFNFREITRKQASKSYNIMLDHSNSSKFVQTQNFPKCFNHVQELFFQIKTIQ